MEEKKKKFYEMTPEERWEALKSKPNSLLVDGEGKKLSEIVDWYSTNIKEGFRVTTQDMENFLDCSYEYIKKYMIPTLTHIRITEWIRPELFKMEHPEEWNSLFIKRMLFQQSEWEDYLLTHGRYALKYKRMSLNELPEIQSWMWMNHLDFDTGKELLDRVMKKYLGQFQRIEEPKEIKTVPLQKPQLQSGWYSLKSIMSWQGHNYRVQSYRYLEGCGINPIHFQGLTRYDVRELKEERVLFYPYQPFTRFQEWFGSEWIEVWLEEADTLIKKKS